MTVTLYLLCKNGGIHKTPHDTQMLSMGEYGHDTYARSMFRLSVFCHIRQVCCGIFACCVLPARICKAVSYIPEMFVRYMRFYISVVLLSAPIPLWNIAVFLLLPSEGVPSNSQLSAYRPY